jgi:hypothetical protein
MSRCAEAIASAPASVNCVLGAIGSRLNIRAGAANRVAGSHYQASSNQRDRHQLLNHGQTSVMGAQ